MKTTAIAAAATAANAILTIDGCWEYRCSKMNPDDSYTFIYNGEAQISGTAGNFSRTTHSTLTGIPSFQGRVWTGAWNQDGTGPISFMLGATGNTFTGYNLDGSIFTWEGVRTQC